MTIKLNIISWDAAPNSAQRILGVKTISVGIVPEVDLTPFVALQRPPNSHQSLTPTSLLSSINVAKLMIGDDIISNIPTQQAGF